MYVVIMFQSLDVCWLVRYFRKTLLTIQLCLNPLIIYAHSQHRTPRPSYTEHTLYSSHFCFPHWMLSYRRVACLTDLFYCWPQFYLLWYPFLSDIRLYVPLKSAVLGVLQLCFLLIFMTIFNVHNSYLWIHYGRWSRL